MDVTHVLVIVEIISDAVGITNTRSFAGRLSVDVVGNYTIVSEGIAEHTEGIYTA